MLELGLRDAHIQVCRCPLLGAFRAQVSLRIRSESDPKPTYPKPAA
jgi:hypothetical protein